MIGASNGRGFILPSLVPSCSIGAYFTSVVIAGFTVSVLPVLSEPICGLQLILNLPLLCAGGSPGAEALYLALLVNGTLYTLPERSPFSTKSAEFRSSLAALYALAFTWFDIS
jgi:hypothetical protein